MSLQFTKRIASELLGRGENSVRIKKEAMEEASKAITRDDIRKLIKSGSVFALKPKHNISRNAKILKRKRAEGRRRGIGRRKGSLKARGSISWEKKVRSQRMLLKELRAEKKLDVKQFNRFYMLIKGNSFANKASLLSHLSENGIKVSEIELNTINERIKNRYK